MGAVTAQVSKQKGLIEKNFLEIHMTISINKNQCLYVWLSAIRGINFVLTLLTYDRWRQ